LALGLALGILLSDTGALVGQDLSERTVQPAVPVPQFSLGKPFPGFGPIGPRLLTPNELPDRGDLRLCCSVDGRVLQDGPTRDMIFSARELLARIYAACLILPGDLIFTGTPPGWGWGGRRLSSSGLVQRWRARSRAWVSCGTRWSPDRISAAGVDRGDRSALWGVLAEIDALGLDLFEIRGHIPTTQITRIK
jgi:2-keto-4-pentenoate hydratase/2-oxohepta-3-ene-1,7-dioic acid hydratase in catechol pathway